MPKLTTPVVAAGTMANAAQPVLRVDELVLRPWTSDDVAALLLAYADPAIQQWHGRSMTAAEATAYATTASAGWIGETGAHWAVADEHAVVGRISVRVDLVEGLGSVGYWVLPAARQRQVATRALRTAAGWALHDLGMHRLEVEHATANRASCRVATKAGFELESILRSKGLHIDGWHDMHLHVRLDSDPKGGD